MLRNLKRALAVMLALAVLLPATFVSAANEAPANGLVPVQAYAEAAGAKVVWMAEFHTYQVSVNNVTMYLTEGATHATANGVSVPLGRPITIEDGRVLLPLNLLQQVFGVYVNYDAKTGKATLDEGATKAMATVRGLLTGKLDQTTLSPGLAPLMPPVVVAAVAQSLKPLGQLRGLGINGRTKNAVHESVEVLAVFEAAPVLMTVRLSPDMKVDDLRLDMYSKPVPVAGAPAYADPKAFTEKEVVVGEGTKFPLPGTLTMPVGQGPFPAVVLVHGSGPNDRDESYLGSKTFRDLAQGLATRGIAVLRYEKRTREHSQKFMTSVTLQAETIDDAIEAGKLLAKTPGIDPKRVFVAGHSLGGLATPRILKLDTNNVFAGGVMMAAPNDFLEILVEQNKILVAKGEVPEQQLQFYQSQIAMLKDPKLDPSKPLPGFVMGPVPYWLDLGKLTGPIAKEVAEPLLVLQGGRDYQVQAKQLDDLKAAMAGKANAEFKLYPKLNHMLVESEGEGETGGMTEYIKPLNVAVYVVDDIAAWVKAH